MPQKFIELKLPSNHLTEAHSLWYIWRLQFLFIVWKLTMHCREITLKEWYDGETLKKTNQQQN